MGSAKSSIAVACMMCHAPCFDHRAYSRTKWSCASSDRQAQFVVGAITLARMRRDDTLPVQRKHDNDS
jgi:hypothetical protein